MPGTEVRDDMKPFIPSGNVIRRLRSLLPLSLGFRHLGSRLGNPNNLLGFHNALIHCVRHGDSHSVLVPLVHVCNAEARLFILHFLVIQAGFHLYLEHLPLVIDILRVQFSELALDTLKQLSVVMNGLALDIGRS